MTRMDLGRRSLRSFSQSIMAQLRIRYSNLTSSFSTSFCGESQLVSDDGFQGGARDEADQFATRDSYARAGGVATDQGHDTMQRRRLDVGDVARYLHALVVKLQP